MFCTQVADVADVADAEGNGNEMDDVLRRHGAIEFYPVQSHPIIESNCKSDQVSLFSPEPYRSVLLH